MTDTQALLEHLIQEHSGEHNAITQAKLAKQMDMNTSTLRSEIGRLREDRNIPIANKRQGYYIIQDREELQEYVAHINQEIESKRKTIEDTVEAFESYDGEIPEPTQEIQTETYECAKCGSETQREDTSWPKQGEYEDKPVCKMCFGSLLMQR